MPNHPLTQQVLELSEIPIAAPSANLFGRLSPTTVDHVLEQLGDRIDLVLDGGPCTVGVESTILHIEGERVSCLRPGGVAWEEIEQVTGPIELAQLDQGQAPVAPGQLPSHYAPRTPIQLVDEIPAVAPRAGCGALSFQPVTVHGYQNLEILSEDQNLEEAATHFFPALHRLDQSGLQVILATRFPNTGLGRALNDRLFRAAHSSAEFL